MTKVLFVCVANGGRSVLAERIFNHLANGRHEARSAGSDPGDHAHTVVVEALAEIGIDASDHAPSRVDRETIEWSDVIVSTCAEEACPVTYGRPRISWEFPDPKDRPLEEVRKTREEIRTRVEQLLAELDARAAPEPGSRRGLAP